MTRNDIKNKLPNIFDEETGYIHTGNNLSVEVERFLNLFGDTDLTYQSLIDHEKTTPTWKKRFVNWKERGFIE